MVDKMSDEEFGEKMYEEFGDDLGGDVEGYRKAAAADVQTVGDEMRKQKLEQMEMRSKKAVELLQDHPLVEYANRNEKYYDVWCGLSVNTTEAVGPIAEDFGLVEPKIELMDDNEHGLVLDVWWEVRDEYMKEWRWRDVDEWVDNYNYSGCGVPIAEVVNGSYGWDKEKAKEIREHQKSLLQTLYEEEDMEWDTALRIVEDEFGPEYMGTEGTYEEKWV